MIVQFPTAIFRYLGHCRHDSVSVDVWLGNGDNPDTTKHRLNIYLDSPSAPKGLGLNMSRTDAREFARTLLRELGLPIEEALTRPLHDVCDGTYDSPERKGTEMSEKPVRSHSANVMCLVNIEDSTNKNTQKGLDGQLVQFVAPTAAQAKKVLASHAMINWRTEEWGKLPTKNSPTGPKADNATILKMYYRPVEGPTVAIEMPNGSMFTPLAKFSIESVQNFGDERATKQNDAATKAIMTEKKNTLRKSEALGARA